MAQATAAQKKQQARFKAATPKAKKLFKAPGNKKTYAECMKIALNG